MDSTVIQMVIDDKCNIVSIPPDSGAMHNAYQVSRHAPCGDVLERHTTPKVLEMIFSHPRIPHRGWLSASNRMRRRRVFHCQMTVSSYRHTTSCFAPSSFESHKDRDDRPRVDVIVRFGFIKSQTEKKDSTATFEFLPLSDNDSPRNWICLNESRVKWSRHF